MDHGTQEVLLGQFSAMLDRGGLHCEEPSQFETHWDNRGKPGVGKVFQVGLEGKPCELRFTLFFDGEEVVKTGVVIKYKGESIINEVMKGDALSYGRDKRIDPIGFLKRTYGTRGPAAELGNETEDAGDADIEGEEPAESFAIAVDPDSEDLMMRAVAQLTGHSAAQLRHRWNEMLLTNPTRTSHDQVSPFIKIWLRKQRTQLDQLFLEEAGILDGRTVQGQTKGENEGEGTVNFAVKRGGVERQYAIHTVRMSGAQIKEKVTPVDPEWWGGMFWGMQAGALVRLPEEVGEVERAVRALNSNALFDVEMIYVNGRHVYWVILEGRARTLVWRPRVDVMIPEDIAAHVPAVAEGTGGAEKKGNKLGRLMGMLGRKEKPAEEDSAAAPVAEQDGTASERFQLGHAERLYMRALQRKSADLPEARARFMGLLYESNPTRYFGNHGELTLEMVRAVARALAGDKEAARREAKVVEGEVRGFFGG